MLGGCLGGCFGGLGGSGGEPAPINSLPAQKAKIQYNAPWGLLTDPRFQLEGFSRFYLPPSCTTDRREHVRETALVCILLWFGGPIFGFSENLTKGPIALQPPTPHPNNKILRTPTYHLLIQMPHTAPSLYRKAFPAGGREGNLLLKPVGNLT